MHPQLAAIIADFDQARARLRRVVAATPDERWAVRADPQRWSVAECVAHLNLSSRAYIPLIRAAYRELPAATPSASNRRYRRGLTGWFIGKLVGPMPRIGGRKLLRMPTTGAFVPAGSLDRDQVVADFESLQDEQIALTREGEGRPIDKIRIVSPFDARFRYDIYSCLWFLPRHQHRHLEQAEEVWAGGTGR